MKKGVVLLSNSFFAYILPILALVLALVLALEAKISGGHTYE